MSARKVEAMEVGTQVAGKDRLGQGLPAGPGIYMMRDEKGKVLYVGKAKSLRRRVRSYFAPSAQLSPRIRSMVERVQSLDYIVTASEMEALILESNYVKRHRPRYNVVLRDDKHFPYLRFTTHEDYPRLEIARRVRKDGASYFGPYVSAKSIRQTLRLIHKVFPIRSCDEPMDGRRDRPCLEYEMKRCIAPCVAYCDREEYDGLVERVNLFLKGRDQELIKTLEDRMHSASVDLHYEEAARYRDQIRAVERVLQRQRIVSTELEDQDVVGLHRFGDRARIHVFFVRGGKVLGDQGFDFKFPASEPEGDLLESFLKQYYARGTFIPPEVLVPIVVPDSDLIEDWLTEQRGGRVRLTVPQRGGKARLLAMASDNARHYLEHPEEEGRTGEELLGELRDVLRLPEVPQRIEAFDVSNLQGTDAVACMVVFRDGKPAKDEYRNYLIKTENAPDDYAMMAEVLERRFRRALAEGGPWPNLILVDGGKGQLGAALRVLDELALRRLSVIAMAKGGDRRGRNDMIFLPGYADPIPLLPDSPVRYLLQRVRDETHRFAIRFHRKRRGKGRLQSILEEVEGIGPARRRSLLRYFGSVDQIREAGVDQLAGIPHMNEALARAVKERVGGEGGPQSKGTETPRGDGAG
ncbi:MAG: excinuclease ABC subunit UvrC [Nitrospinota bacterium]